MGRGNLKMDKKILLITVAITLLLSLSGYSYTAPDQDNVNLVLDGDYTAPTQDQVELVLGEQVVDNCAKPETGDWTINSTYGCNITIDIDMGANGIYFIDDGQINCNGAEISTVFFERDISAYGQDTDINLLDCNITTKT